MIHTVSISDFRQDLSYYIGLASRGDTIIIKDSKKGQETARLVAGRRWDPVAYSKMLKELAHRPVFSAENHPEWATLKDVQKWLRETRKNADRDFSYIK
ncbi:MAG: hypothetical protein UX99_C0002G0034 [Candidatus Amesbacteria bacterium GW2011_GWB1_47_26]|uniref:Antitoxin n=1 Tax=Candidatus Amesbacteria bacterium GW2011_GWC2_45_19 TaxID=1618366 RepID=A0A0G1M3A1_9BACT|nr:MAG: hypothetical protein UX05_C0011G0033 [Candidatus Amesbacteria bacterium GW2011_GWC2_45_19]KKU37017.1 MAG: hypothetical protein UX52_C0034G0005 [Candidatus Amesbacteria bacterium GW2011_GWA1_46_35]KKU69303.1 MAG: hypothetical protein UX93_C0002G0142 [Microgenomates group bacterium GW2011_GWC1_47_20]KKU75063.1 MAG: hypothetical protein UX99_C0002G0034 [Candidatus Amesbacteria bacterium GW2011_GWB1_47_26]